MAERHDDRRGRYTGRRDDEHREREFGRRSGYESEESRDRYGSDRQRGQHGAWDDEPHPSSHRGSESDWEEPGAGWSSEDGDSRESRFGDPGYGGPRFGGGYGRRMRGQSAGGSEYERHFGDQARSGIAGRPAWDAGMSRGATWSGSGMSGGMTGKGPKGYTRSDERIREQVCDCLTDDPHIDASAIEVQVKGGEVTMSGTVDNRKAKRHAEDLIERLGGVKHVQNNLRVQEQSQQTAGDRPGGAGV
jgi:hypothetical protein